ncbi:hypothetical protein BLNAU_12508 [Blattamonas nauphoetae]|uniref:Uncharacterized protein n=1 Tax=Blattamonas nauphoetae TaxID=2049346 RepID=A0ABQ9XPK4_9EUKA|nr:hypothetical protein BLNAU_12508 [Blattamonas nauphoetae]
MYHRILLSLCKNISSQSTNVDSIQQATSFTFRGRSPALTNFLFARESPAFDITSTLVVSFCSLSFSARHTLALPSLQVSGTGSIQLDTATLVYTGLNGGVFVSLGSVSRLWTRGVCQFVSNAPSDIIISHRNESSSIQLNGRTIFTSQANIVHFSPSLNFPIEYFLKTGGSGDCLSSATPCAKISRIFEQTTIIHPPTIHVDGSIPESPSSFAAANKSLTFVGMNPATDGLVISLSATSVSSTVNSPMITVQSSLLFDSVFLEFQGTASSCFAVEASTTLHLIDMQFKTSDSSSFSSLVVSNGGTVVVTQVEFATNITTVCLEDTSEEPDETSKSSLTGIVLSDIPVLTSTNPSAVLVKKFTLLTNLFPTQDFLTLISGIDDFVYTSNFQLTGQVKVANGELLVMQGSSTIIKPTITILADTVAAFDIKGSFEAKFIELDLSKNIALGVCLEVKSPGTAIIEDCQIRIASVPIIFSLSTQDSVTISSTTSILTLNMDFPTVLMTLPAPTQVIIPEDIPQTNIRYLIYTTSGSEITLPKTTTLTHFRLLAMTTTTIPLFITAQSNSIISGKPETLVLPDSKTLLRIQANTIVRNLTLNLTHCTTDLTIIKIENDLTVVGVSIYVLAMSSSSFAFCTISAEAQLTFRGAVSLFSSLTRVSTLVRTTTGTGKTIKMYTLLSLPNKNVVSFDAPVEYLFDASLPTSDFLQFTPTPVIISGNITLPSDDAITVTGNALALHLNGQLSIRMWTVNAESAITNIPIIVNGTFRATSITFSIAGTDDCLFHVHPEGRLIITALNVTSSAQAYLHSDTTRLEYEGTTTPVLIQTAWSRSTNVLRLSNQPNLNRVDLMIFDGITLDGTLVSTGDVTLSSTNGTLTGESSTTLTLKLAGMVTIPSTITLKNLTVVYSSSLAPKSIGYHVVFLHKDGPYSLTFNNVHVKVESGPCVVVATGNKSFTVDTSFNITFPSEPGSARCTYAVFYCASDLTIRTNEKLNFVVSNTNCRFANGSKTVDFTSNGRVVSECDLCQKGRKGDLQPP